MPELDWTPSRRRLVAGAAWTAPVMLAASAAPAMAASRCPSVAITLDNTHSTYDSITITNTGNLVIPATATITWTVQDAAWLTDIIGILRLTGVSVSAGGSSQIIPSGASRSWTLTLNAAVASGGTVSWRYDSVYWNYNSRITLSVPGCPDVAVCRSANGYVQGTTCPTA